MRTKHWNFVLLLAWVLSLPGCFLIPDDPDKPAPVDSTLTANQHIYNTFKEWYLWEDQLPIVNPDSFATADDLVDTLRYKALDRWSYTTSYTELMRLVSNSEYVGYGGSFVFDTDGIMKIARVYNNSPLGKAGVGRGWRIKSVNGIAGSDYIAVNQSIASTDSAIFGLTDLEGRSHTLKLSKTTVKINTVMHTQIITTGNRKIGYLVFDSYYQNSVEELASEFKKFADEKITDLIVDLRYNGGGVINTAYNLVGMIGGNTVKGKTISNVVHNHKKRSKNSSYSLSSTGPSANTSKVVFITTRQTASASELTINALTPFMTVSLVGSPTTGKPVGMYIFEVKKYDLAIVPISFMNLNAQGKGDYFSGLPVDVQVGDDLDHAWGDPNESMLKAALKHIDGSLAGELHALKSGGEPIVPDYKGINRVVQAY
jgi:C-terminal processing protease CtpA/Prc